MRIIQLIILSLFLLFVNIETGFGQTKTTIKNSFIIHGVDLKPADITFFNKSIEAADFEQFRL